LDIDVADCVSNQLVSQRPGATTSSEHVYEVRPRKDKRGFDLISDALPLGPGESPDSSYQSYYSPR
jgi:hypothetical protein